MKVRIIALALLALASSAGAQQGVWAPSGPRGAELAGLVADQMRSRLPADMGSGSRLVAARSEGSTLVQTFEVTAEQFDSARDQNAAAGGAFREGFCRTGARMLFERGVALRVEVTDGTRPLIALPVITDCPPAQ